MIACASCITDGEIVDLGCHVLPPGAYLWTITESRCASLHGRAALCRALPAADLLMVDRFSAIKSLLSHRKLPENRLQLKASKSSAAACAAIRLFR